MIRLPWSVCLLFALCASGVTAAPDVVPGKFVYTIPPGFDPPMIGRSGIAEIQQAAAKLRFPYYVVLVQRFDGETDDDAAAYIDNLATQWQQDPHFRSATSCIFMLSYSPRKYRFLAGSRWEHELGFGPAAHEPFNAIFVEYVSASRKDPKTGIIRMMQAVDHHLATESDPKVIAARKEAARKAEIARRETEKKALEESALRMAREQLGGEISIIDALLSTDARYLPADVADYRAAREAAFQVMQQTDRDRLASEAAGLRLRNDKLRTHIETAKERARHRATRLAGRVSALVVAAILLIVLTVTRARAYRRLRDTVERQCGEWETSILNAQPKYLSFDEERNMIASLRNLEGRTKEVYDSTTREVDDIFIAIGAMQNHLSKCRGMAKRGSFLRIGPLKRAVETLDREFTADTTQLPEVRLFAPETRQVTLRPSEAMRQLEERFDKAIAQWNHLKEASDIRFKKAEEVFTHSKLDEMLKTADEHGIPHRWISDHPLYGDEVSDQAVYSSVNQERADDPVAFLEQLEDLQAKEAEVTDRLDRLVRSAALVRNEHLEQAPDLPTTVLQPQDDPAVTFDTARREEARFAALLASRDDVTEVEKQANTVRDLYRKCAEQAVMARQAVEQAQHEIEQARERLGMVTATAQDAERNVRERESVHANMSGPIGSLSNGRRYLDAGGAELEKAEALLPERRHVEASSGARQAIAQLQSAEREFNECIEQCRDLDRAKDQFEEQLAALVGRQAQYEDRLRRYGRRAGLRGFSGYQRSGGALDYHQLLRQMAELESEWQREVRQARLIHEEEERRRRQEESQSGWSRGGFGGSSGSSWGGGGAPSSSSGGSWGGSSSSSKSSSSGGSW